MDIDISWMERVVLGRACSPGEVVALKEATKVARIEKGTKILEQGQTGGMLFLLRSGRAEVQHDALNPISVATLSEGSAVGEMSFLTQDAASATVVAATECVTYCINRSAFTNLMATHPETVFALFAYLLRHTAAVIRNMNENHVSMLQYISGGRMGA